MNRRIAQLTATAAATMLFTPAALSYVGPGAGLGVLSAVFAVIAAVVVTVAGLLLWPVRAFLRRRKAKKNADDSSNGAVPPDPR